MSRTDGESQLGLNIIHIYSIKSIVFHQTSAITEVFEMLIHDFPFLIFLFCLALEIFQRIRLFLGAVEEAELFIDDCQLTGRTDTSCFEQDLLIVVKLEFVFRIAEEIETEELTPRHLLDVRIPDGWVVIEVERQFAATQFFLTECHFGDGC